MNDTKSGTGIEKTVTGLTAEQARIFALDAGFSEAGLVALPYADEARNATRFAEWVEAGRAGSMSYLTRKDDAGRHFGDRDHFFHRGVRRAVNVQSRDARIDQALPLQAARRARAGRALVKGFLLAHAHAEG